jgi:hypothetical protein
MVRYLRQRGWGASELLGEKAQRGIQIFNQAVDEGNVKLVEDFLEVLTIPDTFSGYKEVEEAKLNALVHAAKLGCVSVMNACLKHGLNPLKLDTRGKCAYLEAIQNGSMKWSSLLSLMEIFPQPPKNCY